MNEPDFRSLCTELVNELHGYKVANPTHDCSLITRARAELAQAETATVPLNCWLDDEYPCPSPCVFDDPTERITDCSLASVLDLQRRPKTLCPHYRTS